MTGYSPCPAGGKPGLVVPDAANSPDIPSGLGLVVGQRPLFGFTHWPMCKTV